MLASAHLQCASCPARQSGCVPPTQPSDPPTSCPPGLQKMTSLLVLRSSVPHQLHWVTSQLTTHSCLFVLTSSKCKSLNQKSKFVDTVPVSTANASRSKTCICISILTLHSIYTLCGFSRGKKSLSNHKHTSDSLLQYVLESLPPEPASVSCDAEQDELFVSAGQDRQLLHSPKLMQ